MQEYLLYQGADTRSFGRKCYLKIISSLVSLQGYTVSMSIDRTNWVRNFGAIPDDRRLEFFITAEESAQMSEGWHETCVKIVDAYGYSQYFKGDLLFKVRRAEDND